jgi:dolichyl-phosphate-mannose--protein O-mannosyl transferase
MACLPIIGALLFLESWTSQRRDRWLILMRQSIWIVSGFTIIYLAGWWIHFALLTKVGAGDSFYVPKGRFFYDLVELHRIMLVKNAEISTQHAYGSKWYTWPLMTRPVFYWSSARGVIYLLGNPVVWYGILAGFVVALTVFFGQLFGYLREARKNWQDVAAKLGQAFNGFFASWVALAMCVTSFVPLMQVSRPLFIYHYFPTLLFIVVFTCSALVGVTSKLVAKWPRLLYLRPILLTLVIAGFVAMLPFTSGAPVGLKYRTTVYLWMPSWR